MKTSLVCSRKSFLQENGKSLLLRKSAVLCPPALTVCCYGFVASHSYATLCSMCLHSILLWRTLEHLLNLFALIICPAELSCLQILLLFMSINCMLLFSLVILGILNLFRVGQNLRSESQFKIIDRI